MRCRLIQTADPSVYKPMLDITAEAATCFCRRQGIEYRQVVGIVRGFHPWHAAFNRIPLLAEMVRAQCGGWVIYLDADAYPFDMRFDLKGYLAARRGWGIVAAKGGDAVYQPNSGILILNLDDTRTQEVIMSWQGSFQAELPDDRMRSLRDWAPIDDQSLLHVVLDKRGDAGQLVLTESFDVIGWPGSSFLRQELRQFGTFTERCAALARGVADAVNETSAAAKLIRDFRQAAPRSAPPR
jgi:hypothetical protein